MNPLSEQIRIRMMANAEKETVNADIKNLTIFSDESGSGNSVHVSKHLLSVAVPKNFNVWSVQNFFLHRLGSPKNIPPHTHIYFLADV